MHDDHWKYLEDKHGVEVANAVRLLLRVPGAILLGAGTAAADVVTSTVDAAQAGVVAGVQATH